MTAAKTTVKTPLLDRLAEHDERVTVAAQRARELAQTAAARAREIAQLREARVAAYAGGDEIAAGKLKKQAAVAGSQAGELEERREGADIAARSAQADRDKFIAANHPGIVAEREPIAHAAVKAIEAAVAALGEGVRAWQAEAGVQIGLLRGVAGRDGRDVPDLAVAQLARDLQRATAGGVPSPLPRAAVQPVARAKPAEAVADGGIVFERIG